MISFRRANMKLAMAFVSGSEKALLPAYTSEQGLLLEPPAENREKKATRKEWYQWNQESGTEIFKLPGRPRAKLFGSPLLLAAYTEKQTSTVMHRGNKMWLGLLPRTRNGK